MKTKPSSWAAFNCIFWLVTCLLAAKAGAQTTAFTYQGRLIDSAAPANGNYDLLFTLRDALTAGNTVGSPYGASPIGVTNGVFTVTVDFGTGVFTGANRWLEISVRTNGSVGAYTTLAPRQPVTSAPYAVQALNAVNVTGTLNATQIPNLDAAKIASGTVTDARLSSNIPQLNSNNVFSGSNTVTGSFAGNGAGLTNLNAVARTGDTMTGPLNLPANGLVTGTKQLVVTGGNVGIGTTTPSAKLHVGGGTRFTVSDIASVFLQSGNGGNGGARDWKMYVPIGSPGTPGSGNLMFRDMGFDNLNNGMTTDALVIQAATGNVGIGTVNPATALEVNGTIMATNFVGNGGGLTNLTNLNAVLKSGDTMNGTLNLPANGLVAGTKQLVLAGGNVGIGTTSPSGRLHVGGGTRFGVADVASIFLQSGGGGNGSARDWKMYVPMDGNGNGGGLAFRDMGFDNLNNGPAGDALVIQGGTGNVGIGKPAPATALDVNGTVTATSFAGSGAGLTGINVTVANNSITAAQLAPGAAAANLNATGQAGVASGGLVLSATENAALVNAGYVRIGATTTSDTWQQRASGGPPSARYDLTSVWTGSEMIVWGGLNGGVYLNDGARYNPAANNWTAVTTASAPSGRSAPTAVWTGSEMIVWGGYNGSALNTGGRYNPAANTWTATAPSGAPSARSYQKAVWTGSEMIVWGGYDGTTYFNDGARYNPTGNSWTAMAASGAPAARILHSAVWTGSEMIIWGGAGPASPYFNDGARYNPAANTWTAVTTTGVPTARYFHAAVWTGSEMIVWGGYNGDIPPNFLTDGGRYNPAANTWTAMTTTGAPVGRKQPSAVWTGSEMLVWGGDNNAILGTGGRYNPAANTWLAITNAGAPVGRTRHATVWTGSEMIVWGGLGDSGNFNNGGRYDPVGNSWIAVTASGAPATLRSSHTAVWTGSEMIVWGGYNGTTYFNDGGRYNPAANNWTAVTTTAAPAGRYYHTAVWTGSQMLVWGGFGGSYLNDGGAYAPAGDTWTAVTTSGAPAARYFHTTVWTGNEMVVWGGIGASLFNTGGRYNPSADSWTAVTTTGAPAARYKHTAVWTGSEMIVWGGTSGTPFNDGARYYPAANSWTAVTTTGAPTARESPSAVWTGTEMIVWGGYNGASVNTGGRYNPAGNSWTAVTTTGAPSARLYHTAVWTGSDMIIWGGSSAGSVGLNDGARYNPAGNSWTAVSATGTPAIRLNHTSIWTGSEMLVWGGQSSSTYYNDNFSYTPGRVLQLYQKQ